ncbi:MAG: hypothetical protein ACXU82_03905 [Caulobacteraceae bacterium]
MITIDMSKSMRELRRSFDGLRREQFPFAAALALTRTAGHVAETETDGLSETFDKPTPFTQRAFGVKPARKHDLTATVFARDIQAAYLEPFIGSGIQVLGHKRAILAPRKIGLNQYGNIPRKKIASLAGKPGVFIGKVTFKSGVTISGVWQRPDAGERKAGGHGTKGDTQHKVKGVRTGLQLLVQFEDPVAVKPRLPYEERARKAVDKHLLPELDKAMTQALATAK